MASNSLLEGLVFGARAAEDVNGWLASSGSPLLEVPSVIADAPTGPREPLDLADIRDSLRALMWRNVGIIRDARGLDEAARQVAFWCRYVLGQVFDGPDGWTLQNMLTIAHLMIAGASIREESRGTHSRLEFPETLPEWERHLGFRRPPMPGDEGPAPTTASVGGS